MDSLLQTTKSNATYRISRVNWIREQLNESKKPEQKPNEFRQSSRNFTIKRYPTNHKFKNYVLVASTGSGKSRTGNTIIGRDYFPVGDEMTSCTSKTSSAVSKELKIRIIDTPGFGDHRLPESHINQILKNLTKKIVKQQKSSNRIDAFILVVKLSPRPASLKIDIEQLVSIFGSDALKSTIILPILHEKRDWSDNKFHVLMSQWTEIIQMISEAKNESFNHDWYVRWDNEEPRPDQLKELLEKISYLPPYTHQIFLRAEKKIEEQKQQLIQQRVQRQEARLRQQKQEQRRELERIMRQKEQQMERAMMQLRRQHEQRQRIKREEERNAIQMIKRRKREQQLRVLQEIKRVQQLQNEKRILLAIKISQQLEIHQRQLENQRRRREKIMEQLQQEFKYQCRRQEMRRRREEDSDSDKCILF